MATSIEALREYSPSILAQAIACKTAQCPPAIENIAKDSNNVPIARTRLWRQLTIAAASSLESYSESSFFPASRRRAAASLLPLLPFHAND